MQGICCKALELAFKFAVTDVEISKTATSFLTWYNLWYSGLFVAAIVNNIGDDLIFFVFWSSMALTVLLFDVVVKVELFF